MGMGYVGNDNNNDDFLPDRRPQVKLNIEIGHLAYFQAQAHAGVREDMMQYTIDGHTTLAYCLRHNQKGLFEFFMTDAHWQEYTNKVLKKEPKKIYQLVLGLKDEAMRAMLQERLRSLGIVTTEDFKATESAVVGFFAMPAVFGQALGKNLGGLIGEYLDPVEEAFAHKEADQKLASKVSKMFKIK